MFEKLQDCLHKIRLTKPLVLNLTNYVTMDLMANSLLALGAAPIMSEDEQELAELTAISGVVNLNLGTLHEAFIDRCKVALKFAQEQGKPVILDPVGVGATKLRTQTSRVFLPFVHIVRGNASEIMALATEDTKTTRLESSHFPQDALDAAQTLARKHPVVVVVSGATDQLVNQHNTLSLPFGSPLMQRITGMGCALTSVIAAFHAVNPDPFEAAYLATAYFGLCGEQAARQATGPGSFRTAFMDALYVADLKEMEKRCDE